MLTPEERKRIYEEEKASAEATEEVAAEKKAERNTQSGQIAAYTMAKEFITKRLKAPGSAESIVWDASEVHVVELSTGGYRVGAWVDAQNAFGAKLRKNWVCELRETSTDTWSVTGVCGLLE